MQVLSDFRLIRPSSLAEALAAFAAHPGARWLAGGTDLLVNLRRGIGEPPALIDLSGIGELNGIRATPDNGLRIGAATTLADLAADPRLRDHYPAVTQAAAAVAGPAHRAVGTLGGNLCLDTRCIHYNQSEWWREGNAWCLKYKGDGCRVVTTSDRCHACFSGDLAPAMLVHGAEAELAGPGGTRRIPLAGLYRDDGKDHLALLPGEMLTAVLLPPAAGWRSGYEKVRGRQAIDFPLVGIAVALRRDGDRLSGLSVAFTGTNSRPVPAEGLAALLGAPWSAEAAARLESLLKRQINPLRTTLTTPRYRKKVAMNAVKRLVAALWAG